MPSGSDFTAKCYGIYLIAGTTWSRIYDNVITIGGADSSGIIVQGATENGPASQDLFIHNNYVYVVNGWSETNGYGINFQSEGSEPWNIHLEYNSVAPALATLVPGAVGAVLGNSGQYHYQSNQVMHALAQPKWWGYRYTPNRLDFDMNRSLDLILANPYGSLVAWFMDGTEREDVGSLSPSSSGEWRIYSTTDLNKDGPSDVLLIHPPTTQMGYWTLDGTVYRSSDAIRDQSGDPCYAGVYSPACFGDFNNDGNADIVMQDATGHIGAWYMNGLVRTNYALFYPNSAGHWRAVGSGDFDHDGNVDILLQHDAYFQSYESQLAVWRMDGQGQWFGSTFLVPLVPEDKRWRVMGTGDFDHDGNVDIVFQKKEALGDWGGELCLWRMDGVNRVGDPIALPDPDAAFNVVGPR
jgi:hypothetical protein